MSNKSPIYKCSGYMKGRLDPKSGCKTIQLALAALKKYQKDYDSIAFTGMSGALFAPELSRTLNKHLIMVRKSTKQSHSSLMVEGNSRCKKYIIVDDFICTGSTVCRIQKKVKKFVPDGVCIGTLELDELKDLKTAAKHKLSVRNLIN